MTSVWRVFFTLAALTPLAMAAPFAAATLQQSGGTCIIDCDIAQTPLGLAAPRYSDAPSDAFSTQSVDEFLPRSERDQFGPPLEQDAPRAPSFLFPPEDSETTESPWGALPGLTQ